jgi:hypothetical protein
MISSRRPEWPWELGRASDGQGVDRAAVVDLHPLEHSRKFISLTLIGNIKG